MEMFVDVEMDIFLWRTSSWAIETSERFKNSQRYIYHSCRHERINNIQIFELYSISLFLSLIFSFFLFASASRRRRQQALLEKEGLLLKKHRLEHGRQIGDTLLSGFSGLRNSFDSLTFKYLSLLRLSVHRSTSCHVARPEKVRSAKKLPTEMSSKDTS